MENNNEKNEEEKREKKSTAFNAYDQNPTARSFFFASFMCGQCFDSVVINKIFFFV